MVSDTLDVAEIFFNIDKYTGIVEVINWDASQNAFRTSKFKQ